MSEIVAIEATRARLYAVFVEQSSSTMRHSMSEFQTVAHVGDIPEGEGRAFCVNGKMIAVFLTSGEYSAINDLCPHMGASLAAGYVEEGGVTCPWHAWRFCVKTGTWLDNPKAKTRTESYPVRVVDKEIQVLVPDPASTASTSTIEGNS